MLKKPDDFIKEGSKGVEPEEADIEAAMAAMNRIVPELLALLK